MLAAMASAGDESAGGDGTTNGCGLRAPLETGAREPTPWGNRTIGRDGLRARTCRDRATGDDWSRGSTETSHRFLWALELVIWFFEIIIDALQHAERRIRREIMVQSPV